MIVLSFAVKNMYELFNSATIQIAAESCNIIDNLYCRHWNSDEVLILLKLYDFNKFNTLKIKKWIDDLKSSNYVQNGRTYNFGLWENVDVDHTKINAMPIQYNQTHK